MELSKEAKTAVSALSRKLGVEEKTIVAGIEQETKKGLNETEAMSQWKRRNRALFDSTTRQFLVFGKVPAHDIKKKDGTSATTSGLNVIVDTDGNGKLEVYTMSFWDDRVEDSAKFEIGKVYETRIWLKTGGYASVVGDQVVVKPKGDNIPTLEECMKKISPIDIANVNDHVGKNNFFVGNYVRTIDTKNGGKGVEVDSLTGMPVAVWMNDPATEIPELKPGERVAFFGRPYTNKKGDVVVTANLIYKG